MEPGILAWQDPRALLLGAMDRLEHSRLALDIACSALSALELMPEGVAPAGLEPLQIELLTPMGHHLTRAMGAGRWVHAGHVTPEMLGLMLDGIHGARETARRAPALLEQLALPPQLRGHGLVARDWLTRSLMELDGARVMIELVVGPELMRRGMPRRVQGLPAGRPEAIRVAPGTAPPGAPAVRQRHPHQHQHPHQHHHGHGPRHAGAPGGAEDDVYSEDWPDSDAVDAGTEPGV